MQEISANGCHLKSDGPNFIKAAFVGLINQEKEEKPLDPSNSPVEDPARKFSDIMHDKNLPERVYNCLVGELSETLADPNSPENIAANLKILLESEGAGNE